ncbi:hypothetical protein DICVIV_05191 [Dictyocaulus viviparus]|uniref:Uncharacterized protein n=1 Tax=Dictyocaulus viviparus TaxID=29172 RepID=A0A0D8XW28_DICVI|nr:hypothetical protein DICVIV_05191 [Dictyocaulus viviparus]
MVSVCFPRSCLSQLLLTTKPKDECRGIFMALKCPFLRFYDCLFFLVLHILPTIAIFVSNRFFLEVLICLFPLWFPSYSVRSVRLIPTSIVQIQLSMQYGYVGYN